MGFTHDIRSSRAFQKLSYFVQDQSGGAIVMSLFILVAMLMCVSIGLDTMRYEAKRTVYQNAADRAVLAAASLDVANDPNRNPEDVVRDYFIRAGLDPAEAAVTVTPSAGGNTVAVDTTVTVPTTLLSLVGKTQLSGPAPATAIETVTNIEVSLVLDNSGSMGSGTRMADLQTAAKQFIDDVLHDERRPGTVSVSLVPFATQVNAGDLGEYLNLTTEHTESACVSFEDGHFTQSDLSTNELLERTGHFNPVSYETAGINPAQAVCPAVDAREITAWSSDATLLKTKIDEMYPYGNTSIELGAKWGLALLDPAARPILTNRIATGGSDDTLLGLPADYGTANTSKILVIMSDGANTQHWDLKTEYRSGPSYVHTANGKAYVAHKTNGKFYDVSDRKFLHTLPEGAQNLTWPEVWETYGAFYFALYMVGPGRGGDFYKNFGDMIETEYSNTKNSRTASICQAARDQGITVYTIGVSTYGQGDATLLDCAGTSVNFYDVTSGELDAVFASIARQINQLRLTM